MCYLHYCAFTGWWFGTVFYLPYIGNSNPNWLIFFRGVGQPAISLSCVYECKSVPYLQTKSKIRCPEIGHSLFLVRIHSMTAIHSTIDFIDLQVWGESTISIDLPWCFVMVFSNYSFSVMVSISHAWFRFISHRVQIVFLEILQCQVSRTLLLSMSTWEMKWEAYHHIKSIPQD